MQAITTTLVASPVRAFTFHGTALEVAVEGGNLWVSVRRVCEALKIAANTQLEKLKAKCWARLESLAASGPDGKTYKQTMIHLDSLPMWLATIEPARVAEHVRPVLERFQVECAKALRDHFFGPRQMPDEPSPTPAAPAAPAQMTPAELLCLPLEQRSVAMAMHQAMPLGAPNEMFDEMGDLYALEIEQHLKDARDLARLAMCEETREDRMELFAAQYELLLQIAYCPCPDELRGASKGRRANVRARRVRVTAKA